MSKHRYTLEKWGSDDGYVCLYMVRVTPGFTGDEEDPLSLSIKKWEFIVDTLREQPGIELHDGGEETCALCAKYLARLGTCHGCPVCKVTGPGCDWSPYRIWAKEHSLIAAEAELEFLRGLKEDKRE